MTDSAFMPSVPGHIVLLSKKDNRFWIIIKTAAIFDSFSTRDILFLGIFFVALGFFTGLFCGWIGWRRHKSAMHEKRETLQNLRDCRPDKSEYIIPRVPLYTLSEPLFISGSLLVFSEYHPTGYHRFYPYRHTKWITGTVPVFLAKPLQDCVLTAARLQCKMCEIEVQSCSH